MNAKKERLNNILKILNVKNGESVRELASQLNVSEMTIRRDLSYLSNNNIVNLVHGAAILNPNVDGLGLDNDEYKVVTASDRFRDEKERIGQKAASLIEPDDVIIIDTGTTTKHLAKFLPNHFPITVLCYSVNILVEVWNKKNCQLIVAGGYCHENTQMLESPEGVDLIKRNRANKAFISAAGVSKRLGLTCANHYEIMPKMAAINSSLTKILLVDSSKFDSVKQVYFAELSEMDAIITDHGIDQEAKNIIQELGIDLYIV